MENKYTAVIKMKLLQLLNLIIPKLYWNYEKKRFNGSSEIIWL